MNVELIGGPQLRVNADGRMEAVLPTSHTESAWRRAFRDALPSRQHTWRISAHEDAITIVFDNEKQFASYMQVAIAAIDSANQEIERVGLRRCVNPHCVKADLVGWADDEAPRTQRG